MAERYVMALQRFIKRVVERENFTPVIQQAELDPKETDCRLNWGMSEKPEVEALLPVLAQIATNRPNVISTKEFRKILVDMGLPLEKAEEETEEKKSTTAEATESTGPQVVLKVTRHVEYPKHRH